MASIEIGCAEVEPYTPKNILITGGAGFIASHVVIRLATHHPEYKVCQPTSRSGCCIFGLTHQDGAGRRSGQAGLLRQYKQPCVPYGEAEFSGAT